MFAIYKREMRSYFTSPIGYIFIAVFLAVSGFLFSFFTLLSGENSEITSYFMFLLFIFIIIIPLLTMKLFSEERKLRTEQLLLTSPVSLMGMVSAKFLAAYTMFGGTLLISCINFLTLYKYGEPNTAIIFGNVLGIFLIGGSFIAIGVFISSLTENQLVAAITTIGIIIFLLAIGIVNELIASEFVRNIISWISIFDRYYDFTYGILNVNSLVYYASMIVIFLFVTVRVYEKRRWE